MKLNHPRTPAVLVTLILAAASLTIVPSGSAVTGPDSGEMNIVSFDGTPINVMVCKPVGASADDPVPIVLHSHGWGGSRSNCSSFDSWLTDGIGIVSISQRGFGASGGKAHIHDPDFEGRDNIAVIDHVAQFDWVLLDAPGDPVLGAIGGSYGGGYQFVTALTEIMKTGSTRFDALAPEITWYDLPESLAPSGVMRTVWVSALYAVGAPSVHDGVHQAYAYGMATGQLPDGTVPGVYDIVTDLHGNGPVAFVEQDIRLDIPVMMRQGITDNLFNLNQGWKNFENTLTPAAREQSYLIGYNGGHVLPNVLPLGTTASGDPCSAPFGGFETLSRSFFRNAFFGETHAMPATSYSLASNTGVCIGVDSLAPTVTAQVNDLGVVATPASAGLPVHIEVAQGPLTVAGVGQVRASLTTLGVDARAFLAFSKGTTPANAQVISNNMLPVRSLLPAVLEPVTIELPGGATVLGAGEKLYLTISPVSDMSIGHGSRTPGTVLLTDVEVDIPVV